MDYHLLDEGDNSYVVQHPDGSPFVIAKNGLDDDTHAKIQALPKVASLGQVQKSGESSAPSLMSPQEMNVNPEMQGAATPAPVQQSIDTSQNWAPRSGESNYNQQTEKTLGSDSLQPAGVMTPDQANALAQPQQGATKEADSQQKIPDVYKMMTEGMGQQEAGIAGLGVAEANKSKGTAEAYQNYLNSQPTMADLQTRLQSSHEQAQDAYKSQQEAMKSFGDGQINPNRVWQNKTSGEKARTIIGILLSGLSGQNNNMALDMLNKEVDNDINAQKSNMDKQHNLYSLNLQKYRDANQAESATRLQMNGILEAQIQMQAAKAGTPEAIAKAQGMLGQLKMQNAQLYQNMSQYGFKSQIYGSGTGSGGMKEAQIPPAIWEDKELSKKLVRSDPSNPNGLVYAAKNEDAAKKMQEYEPVAGSVADKLQQLNEIDPIAAKVLGSGEANRAASLKSQLTEDIAKLSNVEIGGKRMSESAIEAAKQSVSDPESWAQLRANGVRSNVFFKNLIDDVERQRVQNYVNYRPKTKFKSFQPVAGK